MAQPAAGNTGGWIPSGAAVPLPAQPTTWTPAGAATPIPNNGLDTNPANDTPLGVVAGDIAGGLHHTISKSIAGYHALYDLISGKGLDQAAADARNVPAEQQPQYNSEASRLTQSAMQSPYNPVNIPSDIAAGVGSAGRGIANAVGAPPEVGNAINEASRETLPLLAGTRISGIPQLAGAAGEAVEGRMNPTPAPPDNVSLAGYRNPQGVSRQVAGSSGTDALTLQHQKITNAIALGEIGVDDPLNAKPDISPTGNIEAAKAPANAVYGGIAKSLGSNLELDPQTLNRIKTANPAQGREMMAGPEDSTEMRVLKEKLTAPGATFSGNAIMNQMSDLRQTGYEQLAADDLPTQNEGRTRLAIAGALEDYVGSKLPEDGPYSLPQFQAARQLLAKIGAVQKSTKFNNIDALAMGRMYRADPGLLTGGLQTIGQAAETMPTVMGNGAQVTLHPNYMGDVLHNMSIFSPRELAGIGGLPMAARRVVTGSPTAAMSRASGAIGQQPNLAAYAQAVQKQP